MISLSQYAQSLYEFAGREAEEHVTRTVLAPLGLAPDAGVDVGACESAAPRSYLRVFATPPAATNVRFTGRGISEKARVACAGASTTGIPYRVDLMSEIGLPFCMCVRPSTRDTLSEQPPLLQAYLESPRDGDTEGREMPVVVVVDTGCGEAVLRGADVFAPGITSASAHFAEGQQVLLGVYVEKLSVPASAQVEEGNPAAEASTTLRFKFATGFALPANMLGASGRSVGAPLVDEDATRCLVIVGEGIARMDRRTVRAGGTRGVAVEVTWTPQLQPSQATLARLMGGAGLVNETAPPIFLQNYSSMVPVQLLVNRVASQPHAGERPLRLLDACAAPGGKTSLLLSLVADALDVSRTGCSPESEFCLVCAERSQPRYRALVELLHAHFPSGHGDGAPAPLLTRSLCALKADVNKLPKALADVGGALAPAFDGIILDPPCTGLGLRPRLRPHSVTRKLIEDHADYQRVLFRRCLEYLAPYVPVPGSSESERGSAGRAHPTLVYSTCTVTLEENEANVLHFLETNPKLRLARARTAEEVALCSVKSTGGFRGGRRFLLEDEIMLIQRERERTAVEAGDKGSQMPPVLVLRFMPREAQTVSGVMDDSVGFFVAVFELCDSEGGRQSS